MILQLDKTIRIIHVIIHMKFTIKIYKNKNIIKKYKLYLRYCEINFITRNTKLKTEKIFGVYYFGVTAGVRLLHHIDILSVY